MTNHSLQGWDSGSGDIIKAESDSDDFESKLLPFIPVSATHHDNDHIMSVAEAEDPKPKQESTMELSPLPNSRINYEPGYYHLSTNSLVP